MASERNFFTAGSRLKLAGLAIAAMLMLTVGALALRPAKADAWAWKDSCTFLVANKSGKQSLVRPILYTPALPSADSLRLYAGYVIVGIPTSSLAPFTNSGYPISWGCHAFINFTAPGGTVSCTASAPTKGANSFGCEGPVYVKVIKDDDDIAGEVFIPTRAKSPASTPDEPTVTGGSVRAGALPGGGWRQSESIADFGIAGKLMEAEELPAGCDNRGDETAPNQVDTEEVVRGGGDEGVGAIVNTYDNAAQAEDTVKEALSDHSIDCLAKLLNSKTTRVAVAPLPTPATEGQTVVEGRTDAEGKADAEGRTAVEGSQLVISRRGEDGFRPVAYLNVSGWTEGNEAAIAMYETVGSAPSEADEAEVTAAVRIGGDS